MTIQERIKKIISANIPLYIEGESGWGKSEIVAQVSEEMGLPLIDIRLAGVPPEDLNGVPVRQGPSFVYLAPEWANKMKDKEFILFLDELNQASPQTLHAAYQIVLNRTIAGVHIPGMHIIAAGNLMEENPLLTEIPTPLLKRFLKITWPKNITAAVDWLNRKYPKVRIDSIETNPRQTEYAIMAFLSGAAKEDIIPLCGAAITDTLFKIPDTDGTKLLKKIDILKSQLDNGVVSVSEITETYGQEIADAVLGKMEKK